MSVVKNSIYNTIYQVITIIVPIITLPYVSRVLGETGIGKQAYTNAIAQYFIILGIMGINMYGTRQIASVRDDKNQLNKNFTEIFFLRLMTTGLSLVLYIVFFVIYNTTDRAIYLYQSVNIVAAILDVSWLFMGIEDFRNLLTRNLITKLLGVVLIFLLVKSREDTGIYVLILASSQLLGQMIMYLQLPKLVSMKGIQDLNIFSHLMPSVRLFVPQLAAQVYLLLDKIMLGYFTTEAEVGLYDNSQKIVRIVMTLVTSIGTVMIPHMSNILAKNDMKQFKEKIYSTFSFMNFIAIPMAFGLMSITDKFKPWFYGKGFIGIESLIVVNSLIIIFGVWSNISGYQCLIPLREEKKFTISVIGGAMINLILNLVFIWNYKSLGTSVASVIAEFFVAALQIYYIRDLIDVRKLFKDVPKYFIVAAIMYITIRITTQGLAPRILTTLIQAIIGVVVYGVIMTLMKDKNIGYIIGFVKRKRGSTVE